MSPQAIAPAPGTAPGQHLMEAIGMRYVRTYHPSWEDPLPGAELGEVEYEITRQMWEARSSE